MELKNALVVDDSKSARFAMRKVLEGVGYSVETAESAEEAYAALKHHSPDVIFLDHLMPGVDGFDALLVLKQNPLTAALPVVLCSSNEGSEFVRLARSRGAMGVLLKPPCPQHLADVLSQIETAGHTSPALPPAALLLSAHRPLPPRAERVEPKPDALRDEMEQRLRGIVQDLHRQLAEMRVQLGHLDGEVRREHQVQALVSEVVDTQFAALGGHVDASLAALRAEIEAVLQAQNQRIDRLGVELHTAVSAEAHAVSERMVMNAATRISEQIAESILKVLRPTTPGRALG